MSVILTLAFIWGGGEGYQLLLHPLLSAGNVAEDLSDGLEKILVIPQQQVRWASDCHFAGKPFVTFCLLGVAWGD